MSLHLYNDDTTDFIPFWNLIYSPTILYYIVTTGNIPSLCGSAITFFLSFLNTNNVSGYIMNLVMTEVFYDHHFSARPPTTLLCYKLKRLLHLTKPSHMYAQSSFRKNLPQNYVPTTVQYNVQITFLSRIYLIPNSFTLSLSWINLRVKTISFTSHPSIHTCEIVCIFTFLLQKG